MDRDDLEELTMRQSVMLTAEIERTGFFPRETKKQFYSDIESKLIAKNYKRVPTCEAVAAA